MKLKKLSWLFFQVLAFKRAPGFCLYHPNLHHADDPEVGSNSCINGISLMYVCIFCQVFLILDLSIQKWHLRFWGFGGESLGGKETLVLMVRKTVFQRIHLQQLLPSAALSSASKTKNSSRSFMQLQRSRLLGSEITNKPILATACSYTHQAWVPKAWKWCVLLVLLQQFSGTTTAPHLEENGFKKRCTRKRRRRRRCIVRHKITVLQYLKQSVLAESNCHRWRGRSPGYSVQ